MGFLVGLLALLGAELVSAAVSLPSWYGDNMVLQTNHEYGEEPLRRQRPLVITGKPSVRGFAHQSTAWWYEGGTRVVRW